eukprot:5354775-Ditylum_brightwellii.AAC.2
MMTSLGLVELVMSLELAELVMSSGCWAQVVCPCPSQHSPSLITGDVLSLLAVPTCNYLIHSPCIHA